jgi:triphosphoribosyl-dephospho-CoA synthase
MPLEAASFVASVTAAVGRLPAELAPGGRGWSAAVASILEAAAAKPGNVHPAAAFPDLSFPDLVAAGIAIGPALDAAPAQPLGETILAAVQAATAATPSNANLGIILAIAPLAAVPGPARRLTQADVAAVLGRLDAADAAAIWQAIRLARPGGLGRADRHDLADPPPADIRSAMREAADRDAIAALWAEGYDSLFAGPVADLAAALAAGDSLETAIIRCHLRQLARRPDSLIARRHGLETAALVSTEAAAVVALEAKPDWGARVAAFDARLRQPRRLNPGTTADLVAAALYSLLWDRRLQPALGFVPRSASPQATAR